MYVPLLFQARVCGQGTRFVRRYWLNLLRVSSGKAVSNPPQDGLWQIVAKPHVPEAFLRVCNTVKTNGTRHTLFSLRPVDMFATATGRLRARLPMTLRRPLTTQRAPAVDGCSRGQSQGAVDFDRVFVKWSLLCPVVGCVVGTAAAVVNLPELERRGDIFAPLSCYTGFFKGLVLGSAAVYALPALCVLAPLYGVGVALGKAVSRR